MRVRREKRQRLLEAGGRGLPGRGPAYPHPARGARDLRRAQALEPDTRTGDVVSVVGRVIHLRNTGKLCFVRLREGDGTELQAMLSLADVGEESLADFKALVDLGDYLEVTGEVITSRRGELSVAGDRLGDGRPRRCVRCPTSTGRCPTRRGCGCATSTWWSTPSRGRWCAPRRPC